MSEKVQIDIQSDQDQNQPDEPAKTEDQVAEPQESPQKEGIEPSVESADMPPEDLAAKIREVEQQAQDYYDRLLRVSAELDNYRKRSAREIQDVARYANEQLLKELLSVVDNLERAIASAKDDRPDDPLLQGVHLTYQEVLKILEKQHVTPIKALGETFDPAYHQAMMHQEVEDQPANTVCHEMQKGYLIHDRLLRPAMVAVAKACQTQPENSDQQ